MSAAILAGGLTVAARRLRTPRAARPLRAASAAGSNLATVTSSHTRRGAYLGLGLAGLTLELNDGALAASAQLGPTSTAKDVVDVYAPGRKVQGRVAIVTGGNSGIGIETVKALACAGARVILACRSVEEGQKAVEREVRAPGLGGYTVEDPDIIVRQLDLADVSSIVKFAEYVRASESRLDYLVLNAGVMALPKLERTEAGFERQIGVNHFGHALLVRLLRPVLEAQDFPSRVVTVSSRAHNPDTVGLPGWAFDVNNLDFEGGRGYSDWGAYSNSKLANILFARALARRVPADGRVSSVSLHPGVIHTSLWRSTPASNIIGGWLLDRILIDKTVPQGAATTLWACLAPEVAQADLAGAYLSDCGVAEASMLGRDARLADALWEETEKRLDAALVQYGFARDGARLRGEAAAA